jgi:aspartate/methionine/tyrosine aminotransferase
MQIRPFQLERYFAEYEFNAPFLLSASDCESLSLQELLALGDAESLELWHQLALGYTETQGHPLLREEVARLYRNITPDDVLILAPEEGIFIAMHTLLQAGDHVIVTFPGYQSLYEIAQALDCQVTRWTLQAGKNGWELDLDFLASAITPQTRLLVVNFPHNPTGYLPLRSDLEAILRLAHQHNLYLFSDEMYWLLECESAQRLPPICDLYERGVSLFGLSKTFSLPGLRIGWLATQDKALLQKLAVFKDYTTICSSAPSEALAIIAMRARETIVARNRQIIQNNLEIADQFFARHEDCFTWPRPQAGSVAFPRLTAGMPVERWCGQALKEGVLIVPGTIFEFPGEHFRLGLGGKNLPQALERVQQFVIQGATG